MANDIQDVSETFDPAAYGWQPMQVLNETGFTSLVGPFWSKRRETGWSYGFLAGPQHANALGIIHGGMLLTFADHTIGRLAWETIGRRPCVTAGLNSHFIAGARAGDWIESHGHVVRCTRSLVFMQGALTVGGKTILTAEGIWKILGVD